MKIFASALCVALALGGACARADSVKAGDLTIETPWARATPKGAAVGAGYVTIINNGATADLLTGVNVDFADAQVHQMTMDKGVMEMRPVEGGLAVPAHGKVTLAPSGYHIMFVGLKHPLAKGESVKATLTFEHAGAVSIEMPVLAVGSPGPAGASGGDMKGMKM